mmetsp:Transcript_5330/g.8249  ORF Transcript_5330/g.8249 Transcript_5330/m.8249 type:complete len:92 (-) Transcript_5330:445-720(-)
MSLTAATLTLTTLATTNASPTPTPTTIQLHLARKPRRKGVRWADDTVDNEHLGKKSSKICCVYHKPRSFGESSDESGGEDCGDANCHHSPL